MSWYASDLLSLQLPKPIYFKAGVFPELVGKWYTKTPLFSSEVPTAATPPNSTTTCTTDDQSEENSYEKWCYCQTEERMRIVIMKDALFSGFNRLPRPIHEIPSGQWLCPHAD